MTRVMMAVDGSDLDERVVDTARSLFGEQADYWAVNVQLAEFEGAGTRPATTFPVVYGAAYPVVTPNVYRVRATDDTPSPSTAARQEAEATAAEAVADVDDAVAVGEVGDPADVIRRVSSIHRADVVVVGLRDRNWLSKLIDPSVSDDLIGDTAVPLLLVPAG